MDGVVKIKGIEVHPAANIFPLMGATALAELVEDIRANGQRESCSIYKGQLIDGRNRWLACQELGIEPSVGEFEDDDFDVLAYVLSVNLHRRHLSDSQLAMIGAEVLAYHKARAKERRNGKLKRGTETPVRDNCPEREGRARDEAGAAVGVSGKSVDRAATVLEHGSADLIDAVKADEVSVSKAAKIAKTTPKREQLAKAKEPRKPPEKAKEPNTIGELKDSIADFLDRLVTDQPAHVRNVIADYLEELASELRA